MGVGIAVRSRTNLCGYAACVCRMCAPRGTGQKRYVKRLTARSARMSERKEVTVELEMMRETERAESMESDYTHPCDLSPEDMLRMVAEMEAYFDSMQLDDLYSDDDWC